MVGYQNVASKIQSHAPEILIQYAQALLPGQVEQDTIQIQSCFRPLSPDDIPIVGKVSKVPGLFLHTGHGTLGWTLSLATAECLGQSVEDEIRSEMDPFYVAKNSSSFLLPDGSHIHRSFLSPDRYG
jgi:glycine/D-amino acid oxidase-like deaminating enzyme